MEVGVAAGGAIGAGEGFGAEIGGAIGEDDVGAGGFDGDAPLVAGDVPIEFVVVVEEFEGVGDGVVDGDGACAVVGVGDIDFQIEVVALAAGFVAEFGAGVVGNVLDFEEQRVVQPAGAGVFDGNVAVNTVPGAADKLEGDVFGDVDGAAGHYDNFGEEFLEVTIFGGSWRGACKQNQESGREQGETAGEGRAGGHRVYG